MSLLTPDCGLLFWMLLSFTIVFILLAKYGFPVILTKVEERKAYIDSSLEAAEAADRKLTDIKKETDHLILQAQQEQHRILNEAATMRTHLVREAKEQVSLEKELLLKEARAQIEREREDARLDLHRQVILFSTHVAGKILGRELKTDARQQKMIERMLNEITPK